MIRYKNSNIFLFALSLGEKDYYNEQSANKFEIFKIQTHRTIRDIDLSIFSINHFSRSVLFIPFFLSISAIPVPDDYVHFSDPGCPAISTLSCNEVDYCQRHQAKGDLLTAKIIKRRDDILETKIMDLNPEDVSLSSIVTTREPNISWKRRDRLNQPHTVVCGLLSAATRQVASEKFFNLYAGTIYDLVVDYPYDGATGGKFGLLSLLLISFPTIDIPVLNIFIIIPVISNLIDFFFLLTGTIALFAGIYIGQVFRIVRSAVIRTDHGGIRLVFQPKGDAVWHQLVPIADTTATAAVNYYIISR